MPLYLLDTNFLSRLARGIDKGICDKVARHVESCILSSVAWYELEYGAARSPNPAKSAKRLTLLRSVFPFVRAFDEEDATEAASVRAYLETLKPNAQPIGPHDVLLAGHARAGRGARNRQHPRIQPRSAPGHRGLAGAHLTARVRARIRGTANSGKPLVTADEIVERAAIATRLHSPRTSSISFRCHCSRLQAQETSTRTDAFEGVEEDVNHKNGTETKPDRTAGLSSTVVRPHLLCTRSWNVSSWGNGDRPSPH